MDDRDLVNHYSFTINVRGYVGTFVVHRPTVGELLKMEVIESRELGGMKNVGKIETNLARMLSVLDVVIDSYPDWWKSRELEDHELIQEVYDKYVDYLHEFRDKLDLRSKAEEISTSIGYWFRNKYKLSPKDPRYLDCEPWEIELEFELSRLDKEAERTKPLLCPGCGEPYYGNECKTCGHKSKIERYFDPDFNEYFEAVEEENKKYFDKNLKWEEVGDVGGIGEA